MKVGQSLEPAPAEGRHLISRLIAGNADDHDGENGEGGDDEEGEVNHRPAVPLPYLPPQQAAAVDCLASLQAMFRPAFNIEPTITDSNNSHLKVPHCGEVEVQVAGGKVQLAQTQPPHSSHGEEKIGTGGTKDGSLQGEGRNLLNVNKCGKHHLAAEQEGEGQERRKGDPVERGEWLAQVELKIMSVVRAVGQLNRGECGQASGQG